MTVPGGVGTDGAGPAVNDFFLSVNIGQGFNSIGTFSGPNDSVNDLNRVVIFFLLLADRSGGNDRVATARILQQEKYGLSGVNITVNLITGQITNPTSGIPCTADQSTQIESSRELQVQQGILISVCGGTRVALVATADNFPDALSASYAAGRIHAAIYLVRPTVDALAQVQLGLQGLGVKTVLVLGGPAAVPDTVVDFLKGLNTSCTTDSLCGSNPNGLTNGDSRVALAEARRRGSGSLNDTRYGTMRLPTSSRVCPYRRWSCSRSSPRCSMPPSRWLRPRRPTCAPSAVPPSSCPVRTSPTLCRRACVPTLRASR